MYNGQEVGVMHACGHDSHVAIMLSVAEVLTGLKKELKGTVKFIFQPAEEGAPAGEEGGAKLMIEEGVLDSPKVDVMFGLHINSATEVGKIKYRSGGEMAASDGFTIKVKGKGSHGSQPWAGVDPDRDFGADHRRPSNDHQQADRAYKECRGHFGLCDQIGCAW